LLHRVRLQPLPALLLLPPPQLLLALKPQPLEYFIKTFVKFELLICKPHSHFGAVASVRTRASPNPCQASPS